MTIFHFRFVAIALTIALSGCGSKATFTCTSSTYDTRVPVGSSAMMVGKTTFVILDDKTVEKYEGGERAPPQTARVTDTDITASWKNDDGIYTLAIDRVKGSGLQTAREGDFVFVTSYSDCAPDQAPVEKHKI